MKVVNSILSILFALFAIVQYNDPDPWMWIGLYAFVAVVSAFAIMGKYNQLVLMIGLLICLIGLGILLPDFIAWLREGMPTIVDSMKAEQPHIELTREFLGLMILSAALIFHLIQARRIQSRKNK